MKTTFKIVMAAASFFAISLVANDNFQARATPAPRHGTYCLFYSDGAQDCGFPTLVQCNAIASGVDSKCYPDVSSGESLGLFRR